MTGPNGLRRSDGALAGLLALAAGLLIYATWGGLDRPGLYHDEKAYVLQARTYAGLRWSEPSPPVPGLWEQVHVFTEPSYAARYPPGYAAVLAPGAALGVPGLMQVLMASATASLLFLFGSRLVGRWTAFLATALWMSAPINTTWRAAYFSESLTCLLWIAWSWLAWRYRREGRRRDLVGVALLVAFAGITRPVTAIVLALPLVFVLWPRLRVVGAWRDFGVAFAAALPMCAVVPVWGHAVLGSWTTTPYAEYSPRTFPFDMPTLNTDWSPPPRELPPDFEALAVVQRQPYAERTVENMPGVFLRRMDRLGQAALPPDLTDLRWLAPLGLAAAGGAGWVALASALLLLLGHITMPHPPHWTVYYLDVFPVVAFGTVVAMRRALELAAAYVPDPRRLTARAPAGALATGLLLLVLGASRWAPRPVEQHGWMRAEARFRAGVCSLPPGEKIVFVRRIPGESPHHILVDNDPRWRESGVWVVREWTDDRHRALLEAAPERDAYLYDVASGSFSRMGRDGALEPAPVLNVAQADHRLGRGLSCT
jgi:hypothetical protein